MNILLIILLIIVILIAFLLFLALITKKTYTIERDIIIDRSRKEVFDYIKLVKNQEQYSYWVMQDPTNKIVYYGTDGTVGFIGAWEGEQRAGKGEQEIIAMEDGKRSTMEVRFEKPFKNVAYTHMITTDAGTNQTKVVWQMTGKNNFPMNLFNLVIDNVLGKDMNKSLINLKHILENDKSVDN